MKIRFKILALSISTLVANTIKAQIFTDTIVSNWKSIATMSYTSGEFAIDSDSNIFILPRVNYQTNNIYKVVKGELVNIQENIAGRSKKILTSPTNEIFILADIGIYKRVNNKWELTIPKFPSYSIQYVIGNDANFYCIQNTDWKTGKFKMYKWENNKWNSIGDEFNANVQTVLLDVAISKSGRIVIASNIRKKDGAPYDLFELKHWNNKKWVTVETLSCAARNIAFGDDEKLYIQSNGYYPDNCSAFKIWDGKNISSFDSSLPTDISTGNLWLIPNNNGRIVFYSKDNGGYSDIRKIHIYELVNNNWTKIVTHISNSNEENYNFLVQGKYIFNNKMNNFNPAIFGNFKEFIKTKRTPLQIDSKITKSFDAADQAKISNWYIFEEKEKKGVCEKKTENGKTKWKTVVYPAFDTIYSSIKSYNKDGIVDAFLGENTPVMYLIDKSKTIISPLKHFVYDINSNLIRNIENKIEVTKCGDCSGYGEITKTSTTGYTPSTTKTETYITKEYTSWGDTRIKVNKTTITTPASGTTKTTTKKCTACKGNGKFITATYQYFHYKPEMGVYQ
jgi:hypothetical protein